MWNLFNETRGVGGEPDNPEIVLHPPIIRPKPPQSPTPFTQLKMRRKMSIELLKEDMTLVRQELTKDQPSQKFLNRKLRTIEQLSEEAEHYASQVLDYYVLNNMEDKFRQSRKKWQDINEDVIDITMLIKTATSAPGRPDSPHGSASSSANGGERRVRLPKFNLIKFDGKMRSWLEWWAYFNQIHSDQSLSVADKFRYLVQSMENGTEAAEIVSSYPKTSDNYNKAIDMLTQKYGKKDMLVAMYMTDLADLLFTKDKISISKFFLCLQTQLQNLESLGVKSEEASQYLLPMIVRSLSKDTLSTWYRSPLSKLDGSTLVPPKSKLDCLLEFLKDEVESEWKIEVASGEKEKKSGQRNSKKLSPKEEKVATAAGLFVGNSKKCIFCDRTNHNSPDCYTAQQMSLQEKKEKVKEKKCCFICLRTGHLSRDCKTPPKCVICSRKHFVIMCPDLFDKKKNSPTESTSRQDGDSSAAMSHQQCKGDVLLQTVLVRVYNDDHSDHRVVRLLFDSGSQGTSVRADLTNDLNLKSSGQVWSRKVLYGGSVTDKEKHNKFKIKLSSLDGNVNRQLSVLDEKDICGQLRRIPNGPWLEELRRKKIWMSDFVSDSEEIQILVGSDYYGQLMTGKIVHLKCGLTAMESVFGWTLSGKIPVEEDSVTLMSVSTALLNCNSISDLWDLEVLGIRESGEVKSKAEQEKATQQHFQQTVSRNNEGRYSVRLPWVDAVQQNIPNNLAVAEKRLENTTRKLQQTGKFQMYDQIFQGWLNEDFIEIVVEQEPNEKSHYLPHRAVFKPESLTTPVRPVFDASCKTGRNPSLNDCLEKGPNLLELIPNLITRFREKKVGVTADVTKAFQMIEVEESDRDFLRFLWWEDSATKKIRVFRHKRVVFGVNSSPFLLGAVLEKHLKEISGDLKPIAMKLLKSLYVDNCVTSVDTKGEYSEFKNTSTCLLAEAKMELRQWECSSVQGSEVDLATHQVLSSVLGLKWDKLEDTLRVDIPIDPEKITKRVILSMVQKVFDPMGFLAPTTLIPKLILQQAWENKSNWDDEVNQEGKKEFLIWWSEVDQLEKVAIPRHAFGFPVVSEEQIQFHCFGDASKKAYSAAIFVRVQQGDQVYVQLLQAKSRVAPLRQLTIPRLELLASVITTRLANSVKSALGMEAVPTYFWTDSTTVLAWIRRNDDWGTFVGNRVKEIGANSQPNQWNFVPGKMNPADLLSRGCSPSQLLSCCWWEGPDWLHKSADHWPSHEEPDPDEDLITSEKKKTITARMGAVEVATPWYLARHSSYTQNLRLVGWMCRFLQKCRKENREDRSNNVITLGKKSNKLNHYQLRKEFKIEELTKLELEAAERKLFLLVQRDSFKTNQEFISGLRVERDDDGLIRVRSKLIYREDTEYFRRPVLLPTYHPLIEQMITEEHIYHSHAGAQFLIGKLREKCWIIQNRRAINKVLNKCVICRRFSTKRNNTPTAALPEDRVKTARVFQVTGIDLAGPLFLKNGEKAWVVLFTCAIYRCVHFELVDSLSTDCFLLSLSRFISRRGRPETIYTDNGTNFVGASNLFGELDWKKIVSKTRIERIQWRFSPPSGAWWGGWWERLIRTAKDLLKRMLGQTRLNLAQLETSLYHVESVMNERPLTYITEDNNDLIPLTPAMFLRDNQGTSFPEVKVLDGDELRGKFTSLRKLWEELRERFRKEYLSLLIQRGKSQKCHNLKEGDVVLIGDDNKKRQEWRMGRIEKLIQGKDGEVRVATVKTSQSVLTRPIQRLYPLEVPTNHYSGPPETIQADQIEGERNQEQEAISDLVEPIQIPETETGRTLRTRSGREIRKPAKFLC